MAVAQSNQVQFDSTLVTYAQALEMRKCILGDRRPDVAHTLNNMAGVHEKQGQFDLALEKRAQATR